MDTQEIAIVGGLLALAGLAAFMDWRRNNRDDLDRVGLVNWANVMIAALFGALIATLYFFGT